MYRSANAARLLLSSVALATLLLHANRSAAVEVTIEVVGACPEADGVRHLLAGLLSPDDASAAPHQAVLGPPAWVVEKGAPP